MRKKRNVTVLIDETVIPSNDPEFLQSDGQVMTEYHVIQTLRELRHNVTVIGAVEDIPLVVQRIVENKPDIIFNLTEHLGGNRMLDKNIAALLEILNVPFTGTGPLGLMLCRDKRLCKQLLSLHKIRIPDFFSIAVGKKVKVPASLNFPLIVKPALEDSSEGISNASIVSSQKSLEERVEFIHNGWQQPAIIEQYIEGRELYVSVMGNKQLQVFPIRECIFNPGEDGPSMVTYRVKWNKQYREKWNIKFGFAQLEPSVTKSIERICKRAYRILNVRDYGRIDLRLTSENKIYLLEVNPNPDVAYGEEVAEAVEKGGISYQKFIERILYLALKRYR